MKITEAQRGKKCKITNEDFFDEVMNTRIFHYRVPFIKEKMYDIKEPLTLGRSYISEEDLIFICLLKEQNFEIDDFLDDNQFNQEILTPLFNIGSSMLLGKGIDFYKGFMAPFCELNVRPFIRSKFFYSMQYFPKGSVKRFHKRQFLMKAFEPEMFSLYFGVITTMFVTNSYIIKETKRFGKSHIRHLKNLSESILQKMHGGRPKKVKLYSSDYFKDVGFAKKFSLLPQMTNYVANFISFYYKVSSNCMNVLFRIEKELIRYKVIQFIPPFYLFYKFLTILKKYRYKKKQEFFDWMKSKREIKLEEDVKTEFFKDLIKASMHVMNLPIDTNRMSYKVFEYGPDFTTVAFPYDDDQIEFEDEENVEGYFDGENEEEDGIHSWFSHFEIKGRFYHQLGSEWNFFLTPEFEMNTYNEDYEIREYIHSRIPDFEKYETTRFIEIDERRTVNRTFAYTRMNDDYLDTDHMFDIDGEDDCSDFD